MMRQALTGPGRNAATGLALLAAATLAGCMHENDVRRDIEYSFDIPRTASQCPADREFVDLGDDDGGPRDGGSTIRDRDGGSSIRDRDGNEVERYCHRPCAEGEVAVGDRVIDWHHDRQFVEGSRTCVTPG